MPATYELSTDVGRVRLLIPDTQVDDAVFDDGEIETFLELEVGVKRAAALALETIATNEALVLKVLKRLDVQTDGAKLLEALLKRAAVLRAQADKADEDADDWDGFEVIEMVTNAFTARENRWNDYQRGAV